MNSGMTLQRCSDFYRVSWCSDAWMILGHACPRVRRAETRCFRTAHGIPCEVHIVLSLDSFVDRCSSMGSTFGTFWDWCGISTAAETFPEKSFLFHGVATLEPLTMFLSLSLFSLRHPSPALPIIPRNH